MKYMYTMLILAIVSISLFAQSPQKMSYQAVVRNSSNQLLTNHNIGMQVSILQGTPTGTSVYVERHFPTTNSNGLVTIEIGSGTLVSGDFSSIDWANGPYFIKTEIDINGGANYTITGTSELLSVPYALFAENVQNDKVNDDDHDSTNEIQAISLEGNQLSLSKGGGSVSLIEPESSPWTKEDTNIYRKQGYVMIGTNNPHGKLTVKEKSNKVNTIIDVENYNGATIGLAEGINVTMDGPSTARCNNIAVYNTIRTEGTGKQTGVFNFLITDVNANKIGTSNFIDGNSSLEFLGTKNYVSGDGNGSKYGTYNFIAKNAGGTHYAVYGEAEKAGSYAGYFKGDVYVSQKIKNSSTGEANLIPIAYGKVNADGTLNTGASTANVTNVNKTATGRYVITVSGYLFNDYTLNVIISSSTVVPHVISHGYDAITKNLAVQVYDLDGNHADGMFSFVIYKGPGN